MRTCLLAWAAAAAAALPAAAQDKPAVKVDSEAESFETFDGVKLQGVFYKANPGKLKNNSVVILLHAFKAPNPTKGLDDLAKTLAADGYHVLQFTFRGHGSTPTDVTPDVFWKYRVNADYVTGARANPPKSAIVLKDLKGDGREYYPYLVNDVMAARVHLDRMNDNGAVNTSSVYLVGVGDAVDLGLFYATAEWYREAKKPNLAPAFEPKIVSPARTLQDTEVAGKDIAGAVWISPAKNPGMSDQSVKALLSKYAVRLRDETPMLFLNGEKDAKGKAASKFYFNDVLVAVPRPGSKVAKLSQTFHVELKGPGESLVGADLIGKKTGLEEKVLEFGGKVHEERKSKPPIPARGYTKPLLITPQQFGIGAS